MAKGKLSRHQLQQGTARYISTIDAFARVLTTFIKWGFLALICYFFSGAVQNGIQNLAGKQTGANFLLNILGNISINKWLVAGLLTLAGSWAYGERRLRKRTVHKLADRLKAFETQVDNERSSSTLTPSGNTRREDI